MVDLAAEGHTTATDFADYLVQKKDISFREAYKLSAKLAVYADFSLLVLGGKLKQAEMLSARLGDVMSFLYAAMASIRYYEQKVASEDKEQAKAYFHYATRWALLQAEQALFKFLDNFPSTAT